MISVLLAEDHEIVRAGLRLLVDAQPDMQVIAEAGNGEQALARIADSAPDVAVLDLTMPGLGGLAVARQLANTPDATSIVVLTRHDDEAYVRELLAAGVAGYVLKQSSSDELLKAIRAAARHERYVDPACKERLEREQAEAEHPTLTPREREVLRLMAVGHSNKEIGSMLAISVKTVEVHKANAMRKLRLGGRTDVVRYAVLHEWMKDP
jgi:two-component system, NarL family, response regulator NreC